MKIVLVAGSQDHWLCSCFAAAGHDWTAGYASQTSRFVAVLLGVTVL